MNINEIFDQMDYGSTANVKKDVREWINAHGGKIGPHVCGQWRLDICSGQQEVPDASSHETGAVLASVSYGDDLIETTKAEIASKADDKTVDISCLQRFADILVKKFNLLAGLEAVSTGRSFGRLVNSVGPQVAKLLSQQSLQSFDASTNLLGTLVIAVPSDASLVTVLRQLGPSLMAGNRIILYVFKENSQEVTNRINLALFYLAEVAVDANFPKGSFNVIYGAAGPLTKLCATHQIHLDSDQERIVVGPGFSLISVSKPELVFVVCDSADVNAASEAAIRAICTSTQQKAQLKIFVQESIHSAFMALFRLSLANLRIGNCADPTTDLSTEFSSVIDSLKTDPGVGWVKTGHLSIEAFRTAKEVAVLVNGYGHRVVHLSLWTELIAVALEISDEIVASNVWVNYYVDEAAGVEWESPRVKEFYLRNSDRAINHRVQLSPIENFKPQESIIKAVEASAKSQISWQKLNQSERLRKLENAALDWDELKTLIDQPEVDFFNKSLKTSSRCADKYSGRLLSSASFKGKILKTFESLGVVAILPSDESPLIGLGHVAVPALLNGNSVLVIANHAQASLYSKLIKMLALPAGVFSFVETNEQAQQVINTLCHTNIRSIFYFGIGDAIDLNLSLPAHSSAVRFIRLYSCAELKAIQVPEDEMAVGQLKLVWLPSGVTFAT